MNPMTVMRSMILAMLSHHAVTRTYNKIERAKLLYLNDNFIHMSRTGTRNANATRSHARGTSCSS